MYLLCRRAYNVSILRIRVFEGFYARGGINEGVETRRATVFGKGIILIGIRGNCRNFWRGTVIYGFIILF